MNYVHFKREKRAQFDSVPRFPTANKKEQLYVEGV